MIDKATTHAKIGRSMKKRDMNFLGLKRYRACSNRRAHAGAPILAGVATGKWGPLSETLFTVADRAK
jgi:hypothetical protein